MRSAVAVVVSGLVVSLLAAPATGAAPLAAGPSQITGLVVTREAGTTPAEAARAVEEVVGRAGPRMPAGRGVTAVTADLTPAEARAAAAALERREGIAEVGLDTRVQAAEVPGDPLFGQQWYLTDTISGALPQTAWDLSKGDGAVVAVIDSGITAHEDLDGRVLPGYDFVSDALVANDGDGRDPDASDPGDWVDTADKTNHPATFTGCRLQDSDWHGTHVAGLAAAAHNTTGIAGMAPAARILPVRALGKCGGTMSDIVAAITWASGGSVPGVPVNPYPADVVNLSLSSRVTCQPFVQAAVDDARARGAVVVASAGNDGRRPISDVSPAGCFDVLAVGAVTRAGQPAPYSNVGVAGRDVPLFAAGGVDSTDPALALLSTWNSGTKQPVAAAYGALAGTSMAAPLVSGAAALLAARTDLSPAAIARQLRVTARPFPPGTTCAAACGAGILDAGRALTVPPRLPGTVSGLSVLAGDGSLALQWQPPADPGSGPVTGYDVEVRPASGSWAPVGGPWSSTLPQKVLTGLANDVGYQVRVAARSVFGTGPWQESAVVTPTGLPGSVRIRAVRYPGPTTARVDLTLPGTPLEAVQYRVLAPGARDVAWSERPVAASLRVTLPRGVRQTLQVRAVNRIGASAPDSRIVATPVRPTAVRGLAVTRTKRTVLVRWREPRRTGRFPAYRVRVNDGAWQRTRQTRVRVRAGFGRVRVQVESRNEAGRGPVATLTKRK